MDLEQGNPGPELGTTIEPSATPPPLPPALGNPPPPPPRRRRGCLTTGLLVVGALCVLGGLAVCVALLLVVGSGSSLRSSSELGISERVVHAAPGYSEKIAVVDIRGLILNGDTPRGTSVDMVKGTLARIAKDDKVVAVILNLDTPGGEVTASDEIHAAVKTLKVPVVACMRSVCASGGYYIAVAADRIVANELTLTGSIGVIVPHYQYSELLDKLGVRSAAIKSGAMKDMLGGGVKRTPEEAQKIDDYLQNLVDATFRRFCTVVAEGRDAFLTWEDVAEAEFGDGRVLLGRQALDYGLIDHCGYFEHAVEMAKELAGVEDANLVRFRRSFSLGELFFAQRSGAEIRLSTGLEAVFPPLQPSNLYYLMPALATD